MKSLRIQLHEKSPKFDKLSVSKLIDVIKFERVQINIFSNVFTTIVIMLFKLPNNAWRIL